MGIKFTNNAYGTLASGILAGDVTIPLTAGHGARFPSLGTGDYFYATLVDASLNLEVVKVTARATDSLTVVRGQDGFAARAYNAGDRLELRVPNIALRAMDQEAFAVVTASGTDTYTATLDPVPNGLNQDQIYAARIPNTNATTTPTINFNSYGAKTIKEMGGGPVAPGALKANTVHFFHYDGTDMILLNPAKLTVSAKQTIWVPARAMVPRTTNGATLATREMTTNKQMLVTMNFDYGVDRYAQFQIAMPKGWNEGTITFIPYWTFQSGSGTAIFGLQGLATSDGDAIDAAFGTAQTSTDTALTANQCHIGPESSAITIGGSPAENDLATFQVSRTSGGGGSLAATAELIGIKVLITYNAADDS